jgi:hypothetical protein
MYRQLKTECIVATLGTLCSRIRERFPQASLCGVSRELLDFAGETQARIERLRRPCWWLRATALLLMVGGAVVAAVVIRSLRVSMHIQHVGELVQGLDAAVNEMILLSIAIFTLWTLEGRLKRGQALRALHELRCLAHVIDMHQLTKDPDLLLGAVPPTPSSPTRSLTPLELAAYLRYCSELLSLVGKLAALHVQYLPDPVVLEAVNDLEAMTDSLAHKMWEKVTLLDRIIPHAAADGSAAGSPDELGFSI